jgi:hypothetical protein
MEVNGQIHDPAALPTGIRRYLLDRRLGGPRAVLNAVVKRKIPSPPQGIELQNPDRPVQYEIFNTT